MKNDTAARPFTANTAILLFGGLVLVLLLFTCAGTWYVEQRDGTNRILDKMEYESRMKTLEHKKRMRDIEEGR